jgi:uncharacterized protein YsxB (DUF464 family)
MIKVDLIYNADLICGFTMVGHANSAEYGNDLVCAAVSAIVTGGFNAFNDDDVSEIALDEGYAKVVVKSENGYSILKTIIVQLKTIEEAYPKNIKIK